MQLHLNAMMFRNYLECHCRRSSNTITVALSSEPPSTLTPV